MNGSDHTSEYRRPTIDTVEGGRIVEALGPASAYGAALYRSSELRRFVRRGDMFR